MAGIQFRDPAWLLEWAQQHQERPSCCACVHWTRLWGVVLCRLHEGRAGCEVSMCRDFETREDKAWK